MLCGKIDQQHCEDALFVSDDFVAVIDGVSSKTDFRFEGQTTGRIAAQRVKGVLGSLQPQAALPCFLQKVNESFAEFYKAVPQFPPEQRKNCGLQAVCAVYSLHRNEIWQIGDCQVLIDGVPFSNSKKSDEVICRMRALILDILEKRDGAVRLAQHDKEALDSLFRWMVGVSAFANDANAEYGYCVLNGEEIPLEMVNVIPLDCDNHEIVLASDGYPCLKATLQQSEQALAKLLEQDPQGRRLFLAARSLAEGQKSFDDRSYLRFCIP